MKLKVRPIGNSLGIVIPKPVLTRLRLAKGDSVFPTEAPHGFRITAGDPEFEEQMTFAERFMKERRAALRELARR